MFRHQKSEIQRKREMIVKYWVYVFLFTSETLYDDSFDAALGVSFSSGFLGLTAIMSLCPFPSAFLITMVQCQDIKLSSHWSTIWPV